MTAMYLDREYNYRPVRIIGVVLLGSAIAVLSGCKGQQGAKKETPPPKVDYALPQTKEIQDYEEFTGRIDAKRMVTVRARVSGYLDKVCFREGSEVKEGDVLFEIDPRVYQADFERAEANVKQAEAHLTRLQRDYQRGVELLPKKVMSQEDFDKVLGDRDEAEAALKLARAQRDASKLNLVWTKVICPLTGKISRQLIDPGNLVKADDTSLTTIVSLDPVYVYYDVDERTLLKIRRLIREGKVKTMNETKLEIDLGLSDEDGFPYKGYIDFTDNQVDAQTGTLRVRGVFPNPKLNDKSGNTYRLLSPGMFAKIRLPVGPHHKAIVVPERALGTDQGQRFLYVLEDKDGKTIALQKTVTIGSLQEDGKRVIVGGLAEGQRFVVNGLQRVRHNSPVTPVLEAPPKQSAADEKSDANESKDKEKSPDVKIPARVNGH